MVTIDPRKGALREVSEQLDQALPVVMVNLLRFRDRAGYDDGTKCSGVEAYDRYAAHTLKLVKARGGDVVYTGSARGMLIAPRDEQWDRVLLVRYPNFAAFVSMIRSDEYQRISHHRTAALSDSRLIATQAL